MAYNSKFTGARIDALLDASGAMQTSKEDVANKVTSIGADATDEQYPSAKAVWSATSATQEKLTELEQKVKELEGGSSSVIAIESKTYTNLSTSEKTGKVFVVYKISGSSEEPTYYTVTRNLTNVTISNSTSSAVGGSSYTANLSALSGYTLSSVVVTMNGVDVTSSSYSNGVINIDNVVGNIVITAIATQNQQEPTTYSIVKNLENCSISNNATTIVQGSNYSATITPNDGYNLDVVTCTMGGSSVSVVDGVISIPSVTGNIVINATASVVVPTPSFVEFNDDIAKSIAVEHWDTDGDGEISNNEASVVENLGGTTNSYFTGTAITNVDWVSQFSGLKTLWGAFKNCTSLEYVNIESSAPIAVNYSTRNTEIFNGCTSLIEARLCLTDNHADRFVNVFGGCTKLKKVDLAGFKFNDVISLYMPFYNCSSLEEIDLSGADFTKLNDTINKYISDGNENSWVASLVANAFENCNMLSTIKMNGCNEASIQCIERILEKTAPSARLSSITITNNGVNHTYNGSSWT